MSDPLKTSRLEFKNGYAEIELKFGSYSITGNTQDTENNDNAKQKPSNYFISIKGKKDGHEFRASALSPYSSCNFIYETLFHIFLEYMDANDALGLNALKYTARELIDAVVYNDAVLNGDIAVNE